MNRKQLLAAETFGHSSARYADHLGSGHLRFEKLMPDDVDTLERAEGGCPTIRRNCTKNLTLTGDPKVNCKFLKPMSPDCA